MELTEERSSSRRCRSQLLPVLPPTHVGFVAITRRGSRLPHTGAACRDRRLRRLHLVELETLATEDNKRNSTCTSSAALVQSLCGRGSRSRHICLIPHTGTCQCGGGAFRQTSTKLFDLLSSLYKGAKGYVNI